MDIVDPEIEAYLSRLSSSRDDILGEMERLAEKRRFPIVGPLVGQLLAVMARSVGAMRVFEFGSGFGYSAYWFLKGMGSRGRVVLTDDEEENTRLARDFFKKAHLDSAVEIERGDALDIIDRQSEAFDIIFIDCEKKRYPAALDKALPRLRSGGLLLADNVLWFGSVLKQSEDPSVLGIQTFNQKVAADPNLLTTIVPIRDGVSISLKR